MLITDWLRVALVAALAASAVSPLPVRADEGDDQYALSAGHYAQERWRFAIEEFQDFLRDYPAHSKAPRACFFLGEALVQTAKFDQAAVHFGNYLDREPEGSLARPARFRLAEAAYLGGNFQKARQDLLAFRETFPDDELLGFAVPYLGEIALADGDAASAERSFRRALDTFPHGPMQDECRFGLARALEKQGEVEEAQRLYLAVSGKTSSPLADDAQFRLGWLAYSAGRYEEAIDAFESFESEWSKSSWRPAAGLGRGWALLKLDRAEPARKCFEQIPADSEAGAEAGYWLGVTLKGQEDWQAAASRLLATASEHPKHPLVAAMRFHAADALLALGEHEKAAEQFDCLLDAPESSEEWMDAAMRGKIQIAVVTGDHASLDRLAAEFVGQFPKSPRVPEVRRAQAQSLIERKAYERAAEILKPRVDRAATADGGDAKPSNDDRYLLGLAFDGSGQHDEALAQFAEVVRSASGKRLGEAFLAQASVLMRVARFDEAVTSLERFLDTQPKAPSDATARALGNLAICHAQGGELEQAKTRYDELLEAHAGHPLVPPTTEQLANAAYEGGDLEWAERLFARLGKEGASAEQTAKGLSGLAWSQHKAGELEEAAATFSHLIETAPKSPLAPEAALVRGRILQQLGRADAALTMYDLVIDRYADSEAFAPALWAAGVLRDSLEQDREAAVLYERLATECPELPEIDGVLYNWAWALSDLGRDDESAEIFRQLLEAHPQSTYRSDATFRLAQRAFEKGDSKEASRLVDGLLAQSPPGQIDQNAFYLKGQIAAAGQRWNEATAAFDALLRSDAEDPLRQLAEFGLAEASFRQNEYKTAHRRFEKLAEQVTSDDPAWTAMIPLRLAQTLCHLKQWDEAYRVAAEIESRYPRFEEQHEVDYLLGRCHSSRAEFTRARQKYEQVVRSPLGAKTETAAKAQLMIAESHYHQKQYEAALREYLGLEILYDYPTWQAAAVFQAGKCHEMLGEWPQAIGQYSRLLKAYPQTSFSTKAKERLHQARLRANSAEAARRWRFFR